MDLKNVVTTNIVNLWAPPRSAGPKTGHGSPRSEILATPLKTVGADEGRNPVRRRRRTGGELSEWEDLKKT